jgi:hypothetical protein
MARRPLDLMKAVEHEIAAEKASNLGRVADRLEAALAELPRLAKEAAHAATDEARAAAVTAYNACRQRAVDAMYSLQLQREALGIWHHDPLVAIYPIPPKLK